MIISILKSELKSFSKNICEIVLTVKRYNSYNSQLLVVICSNCYVSQLVQFNL